MRVHIISDMEGVAGIVKWQQTTGGEKLYDEGRVLYTEEINAAVRGAKAAGATEIVVMDCHGAGGAYDFNSLVPDLLDPDCEYVVQQEWTEYTSFLESGCDAALFVGMHAMAGTPDGVLSHTVSGQAWQSLCFNGTLVGETGINAALCGHWGVPVLLVTGDRAVCKEGRELLGDGLTTVEVKEGLGRFSARMKTPREARELIEEGAKQGAVGSLGRRALRPGQPVRDRDRVHDARPPAGVREPQGRRSDRRELTRRPRRRLVGGVVELLLLVPGVVPARPGKLADMARFLYKPLGLFFSVLGGLLAGAIFKRVWKSVASEEDAPNATDADKGWGEILAAATVQGAVFGGVKAAIDRAGATGFAHLTGAWPGSSED